MRGFQLVGTLLSTLSSMFRHTPRRTSDDFELGGTGDADTHFSTSARAASEKLGEKIWANFVLRLMRGAPLDGHWGKTKVSKGRLKKQPTIWVTGPIWLKAYDAYMDHQYRFKAFEALHVFSIKHYERELAGIVSELQPRRGVAESGELERRLEREDEAEEREKRLLVPLRELLHAYGKAVDNFERTLNRRISTAHDPDPVAQYLETEFQLEGRKVYTFRNDWLRTLLFRMLPSSYRANMVDKMSPQRSLTKEARRFVTAFLGGASLLVPMIMMTYLVTRPARLIIVSVATLLFAFCATFFAAKEQDIIGATAAYAAVMVGTSERHCQVLAERNPSEMTSCERCISMA